LRFELYNKFVVEIMPGVMEEKWPPIEEKLKISEGFATVVHVDISDGEFSDNATKATFLDPRPFTKYSKNLFLELHMMVKNPILYLESYAKAGFKRFIGQIEKMPNQAEFVSKARLLGEVGLAIDGETPLENIQVSSSILDSILIMTIKAGKSGQEFNSEYLKKVGKFRLIHDDYDIPIEIDGGVNDETIIFGKNAGANRFVVNSAIFKYPDPSSRFNLLKTIAEK
jgi:ribulose-phosphate 3-epimerase